MSPTWQTKDGQKLRPKQIKNAHLGNILRLCQRMGDVPRWLEVEAQRRNLMWDVENTFDPHTDRAWLCWFDVDGKPCGDFAVMLTAGDYVGIEDPTKQEAFCERHRPDAHKHYGKKCSGCKKVTKLTVEIADMLFCEECSTDPGSLFWVYLTWLLFFASLGAWRVA